MMHLSVVGAELRVRAITSLLIQPSLYYITAIDLEVCIASYNSISQCLCITRTCILNHFQHGI